MSRITMYFNIKNKKEYDRLITLLAKNNFIGLTPDAPKSWFKGVNKKNVKKILVDIAKDLAKEDGGVKHE